MKDIGSRHVGLCVLFVIGALCASVGAQSPDKDDAAEDDAAEMNLTPRQRQLVALIKWTDGPGVFSLGSAAELKLDAEQTATDAKGAAAFMELLGNVPDPGTLAVVRQKTGEFVTFTFEAVGYVKDDDKDSLDADAILKNIRESTEAANNERKQRGITGGDIEVVGWAKPPFYDPESHHLAWAVRGRGDGHEMLNYNSRILGRKGVMSANLVCDPGELDAALPRYKRLLGGFSYRSGEKYGEYQKGDKIAEYGLTALIAGGAAVALAKSGLLGKLLKPLLIGLAVVGGAIAKFFRRKKAA